MSGRDKECLCTTRAIAPSKSCSSISTPVAQVNDDLVQSIYINNGNSEDAYVNMYIAV